MITEDSSAFEWLPEPDGAAWGKALAAWVPPTGDDLLCARCGKRAMPLPDRALRAYSGPDAAPSCRNCGWRYPWPSREAAAFYLGVRCYVSWASVFIVVLSALRSVFAPGAPIGPILRCLLAVGVTGPLVAMLEGATAGPEYFSRSNLLTGLLLLLYLPLTVLGPPLLVFGVLPVVGPAGVAATLLLSAGFLAFVVHLLAPLRAEP
jgi:hypothetical protein